MRDGLEWIRDNWVYFMPFVSWINRPYHWIKGDESDWESIERNLMSIIGNVVLSALCLIYIIVDALVDVLL